MRSRSTLGFSILVSLGVLVILCTSCPAHAFSIRDAASSLVQPAKTTCITIGGKTFCKGKKNDDGGSEQKSGDHKTQQKNTAKKCLEPMTGTYPDCHCAPGQELLKGDCHDKCPKYTKRNSYGECTPIPCSANMLGVQPNCKCPKGSTLQITSKYGVKECVCPDGLYPNGSDGCTGLQ